MNVFLALGVLLNCVLSILNRTKWRLPSKVQIPLCIVGIILLILGLIGVGIDIFA